MQYEQGSIVGRLKDVQGLIAAYAGELGALAQSGVSRVRGRSRQPADERRSAH